MRDLTLNALTYRPDRFARAFVHPLADVRTGEVGHLDWSAVDLPARRVTVAVGKAKTHARRLSARSRTISRLRGPGWGCGATACGIPS